MLDIVIMAAGLGTRMRSERAKVLHKLGGRPLIGHVCRTAAALKPDRIVVIVGHQAGEVEAAARASIDGAGVGEIEFVLQEKQLGTGHAVQQAAAHIGDGESLVLSGDVPLVQSSTLSALLAAHRRGAYAATLLSTRLSDPSGYGRIVRAPAGDFRRIVEHRDASEAQLAVDEINAGIYAFQSKDLVPALASLSTVNAQGEYYLTDVLGHLVEEGLHVGVLCHTDPHEVLGVNTRIDLAESETALRRQTLERLMLAGVTVIDPATTYVDDTVAIASDTILHPGVAITGATHIGGGCTIGAYSQIADCEIAENVLIRPLSILERAKVAEGAQIGPFARLRPGTELAADVHIGNFVEVKNTTVGEGSKANHLTYLGDAEIGSGVNIGAGTITCNYDGKNKHRTTIGDNVHLGSDTMLVAPVTVGRGSKTGAGAVVTHDVPEDSLAVGVPARSKKLDNA